MALITETWLTISGFCIGICAYAAQSIGKGLHKLGINKMLMEAGMGHKLKRSGPWIVGTFLMVVYMVLQWLALLVVPVNLIAPLDGLSLVILLAFSRRVLRESLTPRGIAGVLLVIFGTVISAIAFDWNGASIMAMPNPVALFTITIPVPVGGCIVVAILVKIKSRASGAMAGMVAGILIAMETISKRISAVPDPGTTATFSILAIVYAGSSLVMNQVGYANGAANVVVPCATSTSVMVAIILGLGMLGETINAVQVIGMGFIIPGIILLAMMVGTPVHDAPP
ncbi:MAG: DMT family transporter [Candidatus Lokiarchaeota archaeon]|nr:DMT family transporter [Candidatus Lokiarchaeota archaeon]